MKTNYAGNLQAIGIARVSSHRQGKDGLSLELQEIEFKEYARKNGLNLVDVEPIVESAKDSEKRKKFQAQLDRATKLNIVHILFYQLDRESRNLSDNERIEKLIRAKKIVVHYVRDGKIYDDKTSDGDFFVRDVMAASAKQFVRNLSIKVRDAMELKAEQGWYPGNHVPVGYVHHHPKDEFGRERKRGTIITRDPNPNNVAWVQREFELRSQGFSYDAIRQKCIEEGLVPLNRAKTYRHSTVEKRIKNCFYWGRFNWQEREYKGNHELIIPKSILDAVAASFREKPRFGRQYGADEAIFNGGWLKCANPECDCQITFDPKTKVNKNTGKVTVYNFYHCTNGRKIHERQQNIAEEKIWSQFESALDQIGINELFAKKISEALNDAHEQFCDATKIEMSDCRKQLESINERRDRLFDLFVSTEISREDYERQNIRLKSDQSEIMNRLEAAQLKLNGDYMETAKTILELANNAKALWKQRSPLERRQFLDLILSNRLLDGVTVRFELKKPFKVLAEMRQKENWRSHGDCKSLSCDLPKPKKSAILASNIESFPNHEPSAQGSNLRTSAPNSLTSPRFEQPTK